MKIDVKIEGITIDRVPDEDPDLSWLDQDIDHAFNVHAQMRKDTFGDTWFMMGVVANARISADGAAYIDVTNVIAGLWGIESDSGDEYFDEIAKEVLGDLHDQLRTAGWTDEEILAAPVSRSW